MAAPPAQPERRQNTSHSASSLRSPITGLQSVLANASPQFWKMPSRSTVSTPVALASAAAWFASGERRLLAGIDFGSETMFMPRLYAAEQGGQPCNRGLIGSLRQLAVMGQVAEPRQAGLELQFDGAGRAVPLLADHDSGLAMHQRHVQLPFLVFRRAGPRLLVGEIVFLTDHEHHHVSVLFDRPGFTQVRQWRTLVVAALR